MRYISKANKSSFRVQKEIRGKCLFFGTYPTVETAQRMRDEMEAVDWDKSKYQSIRDKLRAEGVEL